MRTLIFTSLLLNIMVLLPLCYSMITAAGWTASAYGADTPARGVLLSIYLAILLCSGGLLLKPVPAMVATLLLVQILYKLTTPFSVGSFANPVVLSNLAIAAFHAVTLWSIWKHGDFLQ